MLRRANHTDVSLIQSVLNRPDNWDKLASYSEEAVLAAIEDERATVFVWEEGGQRKGFCWLCLTPDGTKIEEFGVIAPGQGVGSRFFPAVLKSVEHGGGERCLWLAVAADNTDAIRFYEKFGFVGSILKKSFWKRRKGPIADALIMTYSP